MAVDAYNDEDEGPTMTTMDVVIGGLLELEISNVEYLKARHEQKVRYARPPAHMHVPHPYTHIYILCPHTFALAHPSHTHV